MTTIPQPDTLGVCDARLAACSLAAHEAFEQGDLESYDAAVELVDQLLDQRLGLMRQRAYGDATRAAPAR